MSTVTAATPAASVLLARGPNSPEVLLVRRSEQLRFFGGFWAFPGGKVTAEDSDVALAAQHEGRLSTTHNLRAITAVRELFEETGVLLAHRPDGTFPAGDVLNAWRQELLEEWIPLAGLLQREQLTIWAEDLTLLGDITTPAFTTLRFDTTFFVAQLPSVQQAHIWPGELTESRWATAADMLLCWRQGECLLSPPTIMTLQACAGRAVDEVPAQLQPLLRKLDQGAIHPIFFAPEVQMIPLRTVALPPSQYTNAFLVGREPAYLLDPGPEDPVEQQRLFAVLEDRQRDGVRLAAIILTHQHPDHIGAALACAARYRLPIWAHPLTAEKLAGRIPIQHDIRDGDRLDLGQRPDGSGPWYLEALHTPGHAVGHLCFYEPYYRLLFAADMVSPLSSIIIAPPEGDLAVYLQSLHRLQTCAIRLLLPAHGNASSLPQKLLAESVEHRHKREQLLLAALSSRPRPLSELVLELYKGTPAAVLPLAEKQLLAGLQKLERESKVQQTDKGWRRSER